MLHAPIWTKHANGYWCNSRNGQDIMFTANSLYQKFNMKRVYYSGYIPISGDERLRVLETPPPLIREHRLYQTDWLMRFYGFTVNEIVK